MAGMRIMKNIKNREVEMTDDEYISSVERDLVRLQARPDLNKKGFAVKEYNYKDGTRLWHYLGHTAEPDVEDAEIGEYKKARNGIEMLVTREHPWELSSGHE